MASFIYNRGKKRLADGNATWGSASFKVMLVTSAYTPNPDHDFVSSASSAELTGTGYVAGFAGSGRKAVTGAVVTESDSDNRAYFDMDDVVWTAISAGTIAGMILIQESTTDANSSLIAYLELATPQPTTGGDVSILIPSTGWGYI